MTRVRIVAEAGVNHNGDLQRAIDLIHAAKEAGADVVKFQAFTAQKTVTKAAATAAYQAANTGEHSQFRLISQLEIAESGFEVLAQVCREVDIAFLATPFDLELLPFLCSLGMPAIKIASGEATNTVALRRVAPLGLPIWLSTGMCSLQEVSAALHLLGSAGAQEVVILHCTSLYPAPPSTLNLRALTTLRNTFGRSVGLSDHSLGTTASVAAVALGAELIEKHITLDKRLEGPDHAASLEPSEFREMVRQIRALEPMLGDGEKRAAEGEEAVARLVRRSWHAARTIPKGSVIRAEDLSLLRPAEGLPPGLDPSGQVALREVGSGSPIKANDVA